MEGYYSAWRRLGGDLKTAPVTKGATRNLQTRLWTRACRDHGLTSNPAHSPVPFACRRGVNWLQTKSSSDFHFQSHPLCDAAHTDVFPEGITSPLRRAAKMIFSSTQNKGLQGDFTQSTPVTLPALLSHPEHHFSPGFCSLSSILMPIRTETNPYPSAPRHEAGT